MSIQGVRGDRDCVLPWSCRNDRIDKGDNPGGSGARAGYNLGMRGFGPYSTGVGQESVERTGRWWVHRPGSTVCTLSNELEHFVEKKHTSLRVPGLVKARDQLVIGAKSSQ